MPDQPIDQAENVTSIRLKVPTAVVPIPPPGYVQLHAPDVDGLAIRRGDGSVLEIGGGGGLGDITEIQINGHSIVFHDVEGRHELTLYPEPGSNIKLAGPVTNQQNEPFLPVLRRTTHLTSAHLLALDTIPVVVVPSPGAGKVAQPLIVTWRYTFVTAPYTFAGEVHLRYSGDLTDYFGNLVNSQDFSVPSAESRYGWATPQDRLVGASELAVGSDLVLSATEPITDGDGTLDVTVLYLVV